jgi:hypothetical protein
VDTTNFRRYTHNLDSGERLHVVERFTRADEDAALSSAVDDPDTWATSWIAEWSFRATNAALLSVECHEGNYAIENLRRGARAEERIGFCGGDWAGAASTLNQYRQRARGWRRGNVATTAMGGG